MSAITVFVVWVYDYDDRSYRGAFATLAEAKTFSESLDIPKDYTLSIEGYAVGSPDVEQVYRVSYTMPLPDMWSDTPGLHEIEDKCRKAWIAAGRPERRNA